MLVLCFSLLMMIILFVDVFGLRRSRVREKVSCRWWFSGFPAGILIYWGSDPFTRQTGQNHK